MNEFNFISALKAKNIEINSHQLEQFEIYYKLLIEWNQKINLTAITEKNDVYLKHFYDSLMPLWLVDIPKGSKLVDVGAGAGFPSIPMKIMRPDLEITIIDSLNKRIQFLDLLSEKLELTNVNNIHARAEEAGQDPKYREQFDFVTARAVASLNILSELCLPLVHKGGYFLSLKGQKADEEIIGARKAMSLLGAKFENQMTDILPVEESERSIIVIKKTLDTPKKYPRRAGKPNKQPIQ